MNIVFEKKNADRLLNNTFLFDDPWAMEATHIPFTFEDKIDWNINPFGDNEFTFMLSRHDFVLKLAQVGEYLKQEQYLYKSRDLIFDFIKNAKCEKNNYNTSWRSLDSGIRVKNWIKAYFILNKFNILTKNEKDIFFKNIKIHIDYLSKIDTPFTQMSNWGIIGDSGLFCSSLFLNKKQHVLLSQQRLLNELENQIDNDGFHWEQSPMYHVEVLISLLDVIDFSNKYTFNLDSKIVEISRLMSYSIIKSQKPNYHQIIQGDSDDTDVRDIITKAALLLNDKTLKYFSYKEITYPFDEIQIKKFGELETKKPIFKSCALEESGNYYIRSGWDIKTDSLIHFTCGSLGSGHGHSNLLHFDFSYKNKDILVDSGRYTYTDCKERYLLKSTAYHNSLIIDDIDYFKIKDSWSYKTKGSYIKGKFIEKGPFTFVNGYNTSYLSINNCLVERKILSLNKGLFLVFDVITTKTNHKIKRYFHFDNEGNINIENNIVKFNNNNFTTHVYFEEDSLIKSQKTLYSKHYNKIEEKESINVENNIKGKTSLLSVINVNDSKIEIKEEAVLSMRYNTIFKKSEVRAFSIKESNSSYTVLFSLEQCHEGVDLYKANNLVGFGKTLVFDNKKLYKIEL